MLTGVCATSAVCITLRCRGLIRKFLRLAFRRETLPRPLGLLQKTLDQEYEADRRLSSLAEGSLNRMAARDGRGARRGFAQIYFSEDKRGERANADAIVQGPHPYDYAGSSIASVGDTNRDGHSDLLVGAWGGGTLSSRGGAAYLLLGSSL